MHKQNMSDFQEYKLITDDRLEEIEEDIKGLKEDIRGIKSDIRGIKSEIGSIKSKIKSLAQKIDFSMNNAPERDKVAKQNRPKLSPVSFQDLDPFDEDIALKKRNAPDKNK